MIFTRLIQAASGWAEDQAAQKGAALAYYALFSFTPLLILAVALLGMAYSEAEARGQVIAQVETVAGVEAAQGAQQLLDNAQAPRPLGRMTLIGAASLLFGASGMFTSLRSSLHSIWRINVSSHDGLVWGIIKTYLLASLMTVVVCIFILASLAVSALVPQILPLLQQAFPSIPYAGLVADLGASALLLTILFTFTFRILSDRTLSYWQVAYGAFVTAVLFTLGKMAIGLYLGFAKLESAYGAAGSVVVFLAWVYYSAQIVFFGAEVVRAGLPRPSGADAPGVPDRAVG
jgi:membrane protein